MVVDGQRAQDRAGVLVTLREVGLLAHEVGGLDLRPLHPGLDDAALAVELGAVGAVALLDAAGRAVDADAGRDRAVRLPRLEQRLPQAGGLGHRDVELPAELADVGDARGEDGGARDLDLATGEEAEAGVADVVGGERGDDVAGAGAPDADGGDVVGEVGEGRRARLRQVAGEPGAVGHAVRAAGDDPEVVLAQAHHGEVGAEAALGVEDRGVDDLADGDVALGHAGGLHDLERLGALDVEEAERRQVDDRGRLAHAQVLGVDDRAPPARVPLVLARHHGVAVGLQQPGVGLVPEGALPAGGLEEDGAELGLRVVHGREPLVAVGLVLLGRVDDAVGLDERLGGAQPGVLAPLLVGVEAGDVAVVQVDLGVAVGHPLRDGPSDAGALLDPHGGGGPEPADLALAQDRVAVAGQREQAVDGVAHLRALGAEELGHQLVGLLELGVEVVGGEGHLGRRELRLLVGGDVLGLVEDRAVGVGADLHVGAVLALVAEGVHVAHDREGDLALLLGQLRARPDADHLVHRRGQRDADAGHVAELGAPHARSDHDRARLDVAAGGPDAGDAAPSVRAVLGVEAGHLDGRDDGELAGGERPLAHDRAGAERVDDADAGGPEGADELVGLDEGDLLLHERRADQLGLDAPRPGARHAAAQLLHPLLGAGDLEAAGLGEDAHLLVLRDRVERDVGDLAGVVDGEDEVRRVTRGAARVGQRALVDLHHVLPPQSREVVHEAVADDAGSDHDDVGGRGDLGHGCLLG